MALQKKVVMKNYNTRNCVACGKKAIKWSGHVHKNKKLGYAGFCYEHKEKEK